VADREEDLGRLGEEVAAIRDEVASIDEQVHR
jgi:hypothetical protein